MYTHTRARAYLADDGDERYECEGYADEENEYSASADGLGAGSGGQEEGEEEYSDYEEAEGDAERHSGSLADDEDADMPDD